VRVDGLGRSFVAYRQGSECLMVKRGGCAVWGAGGCCHRGGDAGVLPGEGGSEEAETGQEDEDAE
jgi:hypothetical protein